MFAFLSGFAPFHSLIPPLLGLVCLEGKPSVAREFDRAIAVVIAEFVRERAVVDSGPWLEGTMYTVKVTRTLHGTRAATMELFSENTSGRFPIDSGKPYLLFVSRNAGRLGVDNCGNSAPVAEARTTLERVERLRRDRAAQEASPVGFHALAGFASRPTRLLPGESRCSVRARVYPAC